MSDTEAESNRLLTRSERTSAVASSAHNTPAGTASARSNQPQAHPSRSLGPNRVATDEEIVAAAGGKKAVEAYRKKLIAHQDKVMAENARRAAEYAKLPAASKLYGSSEAPKKADNHDDDEEEEEDVLFSASGGGRASNTSRVRL